MYIVKNAFKSIFRAKGRNLLIGLIVLVLSVSSCIGLSIRQANTTLKKQYADEKQIVGTITSTNVGPNSQGLSLEKLQEYSENELVESTGYTQSLYFSASSGIEPLDVSGSFEQNRDFRDKYGDVRPGEKVTTESTESGTSSAVKEDTEESRDEASLEQKQSNVSVTPASKISAMLTPMNTTQDTPQNDTTTVTPQEGDASDTSGDTSADGNDSTSDNGSTDDTTDDTQNDGKGTPSTGDTSQDINGDSKPNQDDSSTTPPPDGKPSQGSNIPEGNDNPTDGGNKNNSSIPDFPSSIPQNDSVPNFTMPENDSSNKGNNKNNDSSKGNNKIPNNPDNSNGQPIPPQYGDTFITNNQFFFNMASMNDFTIIGYSGSTVLPEYVAEADAIDFDSDKRKCVISKNLAEENGLEIGDTFKLCNPDNEDEIYKFTVAGICDTSKSGENTDTSSNASFTDNYIHISALATKKLIATSEKKNATKEDESSETKASEKENKSGDSEKSDESDTEADEVATPLSPIYEGTLIFKNLTNFNEMSEVVAKDNFTLVSEDVENYEKSIEQLDTLGSYAAYFLVVIFIIGGIVLIIINLFSIRDRKYEIGVLTAVGMKKYKVATQFVIELFAVTFIFLTLGSAVGAATSVPITNGLLQTINSAETTEESSSSDVSDKKDSSSSQGKEQSDGRPQGFGNFDSGEMPERPNNDRNGPRGSFENIKEQTNSYIASVSSATDLTVIGQMIVVGLGLTLISALSAMLFIMRYEPLKILTNRD